MNGEFLVLAFIAALNPKLLALDLLLIENRRPRAMFAYILAGGLGVAIAIGLVDVLLVHADAVKSQGKVSAGIIEFLLIIVPWALLELRPEGTIAMLRKSQAWLAGHAQQVLAGVAVTLGTYLVISALVRLP